MKEWSLIGETDDYLALNKSSGLLTLPDRFDQEKNSLKQILDQAFGKIWIVHRLDRDTSGIILFARNESAHRYYSGLFANHEVEKIYFGLVHGKPPDVEGTLSDPIAVHPTHPGRMVISPKGKPAVTHYKLLEDWGHYSWIRFRIETGRTHQIRIHMKHLGNPLVSDPIYGSNEPIFLSKIKRNYKPHRDELSERPLLNRLALHAGRLTFKDQEGEAITLEAPLPRDLQATLNQLRKWK